MAKMVEFTSDERDEIKKQALNFWRQSSQAMGDFFTQINDFERAWRVQLPQDLETKFANVTDRSSLVPPDFYINIKSQRATIRSLVFGERPYARLSIEGQPNLRSDNIVKAENLLQALLDMQHDGKGFEYGAVEAIHQSLWAGIGCTFTGWKTKYQKKLMRNPYTGLPMRENGGFLYENVPIISYPQTDPIDIRRVRIDPSADRREDIRIVGYHYLSKLSDLLMKNRDPLSAYDFDEKELTRSSFPREDYYKYISGENEAYPNKALGDVDFSDKNVEIIEVHGLFRFMRDDGTLYFRDLIVYIANRNILVGAKYNELPFPSWELFDFPSIDHETGRLLTMGVVEPLFDEFIELFFKRSQALDQGSRETYEMYIGDKTACQDLPDTLEFDANKVYLVDTLSLGEKKTVRDVFAPIPQNPRAGQAFQQAAILSEEIKRGVGRSDWDLGLNPQRQETATSVVQVVSGGRVGMEELVKNLKDTFFSPAWRKHLILWNLFRGHEQHTIYDMQGQQFTVEPGELENFYTVSIDISTSLDRPALERRTVEMSPVFKDDPFIDPWEFRRTVFGVLKFPNKDRILKPNEYLQTIILRENMAMAAGVQQPVSPFDSHSEHIAGHQQFLSEQDGQQGSPQQFGQNIQQVAQVFASHLTEHQNYINQMSKGIANTKEFGVANVINPEHAAAKVLNP